MVRGYQGDGLGDPTAMLATRQALRRLLRDPGRARRQRSGLSRRASCARGSCRRSSGSPGPAAAPSCSATSRSTACRSPRTTGCSTTCSSGEWGFTGTLVTDWDNVGRMVWEQRICADYADAAAVAVKAGNDLIMATPEFFEGAQEAVARGLIAENDIDDAVRADPAAEVRARALREPARPRPRASARGDRLPRARRPQPRDRPPLAGAAAQRRHPAPRRRADRGRPAAPGRHRAIAVVGPNADDAADPARRLGGSSGQVDWMPDGHPREMVDDGARRPARASSPPTGRSRTPAEPTS